jgi:S-adenosylmethionine-diacylglycerol 3-amino-3-carboxypropyl transferase
MAHVLRARLERLACGFPLNDNYFAWQAFGRGYGKGPDAPLPPWLQPRITPRCAIIWTIEWRHTSFTDHLATSRRQPRPLHPARRAGLDGRCPAHRAVERDHPPPARARACCSARPEETLLPGRVPDAILDRWDYDPAEARELILADRSSIYGGLHLYRLKD